MTINRRTVIRQLTFFSAGIVLLPACSGKHSKPDLVLNNFSVDDAGQRTLDAMIAALIPTTETPGARETGASLFVLKMLDDCSSKTDQENFFKGLKQLDEVSRKTTGGTFVEAGGAQREAILTSIGKKQLPGDELNFFYSTVRKLTILAYTTSPYFLTNVQVYELVPGRWHGNVPLSASPKTVS